MGHEYCGVVEEVGSAVKTVKPGQFVIGSFCISDNTCPNCQAGYQSGCQNLEFMSRAQAPMLRVPFADGTLVATPELPSDDIIPSLLTISDVLGTGWFAADAANVKPESTAVVVGDGALRLLPRPASRPGDADFGECGFRKRSFSRRGTLKPNSQRKTLTVDQYHPLRALATLGFADCEAPFLAGAKLPSRKLSSHFKRPFPSSAPSSARHASSQMPSSSHCFSRRQQVAGDGYWAGRNRHGAPVLSTHNMPCMQSRFEAQGRPRLSLRRFGSGNSGSISSHCSSVNNSNRFLLMLEAEQSNVVSQK
jgi:hypothetical protein